LNSILTLQSSFVVVGVLAINFSLAAFWMNLEKLQPILLRYRNHLPLFVTLIFLATWIFIFWVYKFPVSGDVLSFFIPQGVKALSGSIPNRDFTSSYMPLFPYLMGLVYKVYPDSYALGFFFTLCLIAFSFIFYYLLRSPQNVGSKAGLFLVGLLNSVVLLLGIGYQQDECFILLLIGLLFLAVERKYYFMAGIMAGLTLFLTKLTSVVFWLPCLLFIGKRKELLKGASLSTFPVLAVFLLLGFSPMTMLSGESAAVVPPSLITNLRLIPPLYLFFRSSPLIPYFFNALVLSGFCILILRRQIRYSFRDLFGLVVILWLLFLILSLKSLTSYRLLVIPFIPFVLDVYRHERKYLPIYFAVYCSLVSIHYMFYEDWNKITVLHPYFSTLPATQVPQYVILTTIELLITGFEIAWVFLATKSIVLSSDEQNVTNPLPSS